MTIFGIVGNGLELLGIDDFVKQMIDACYSLLGFRSNMLFLKLLDLVLGMMTPCLHQTSNDWFFHEGCACRVAICDSVLCMIKIMAIVKLNQQIPNWIVKACGRSVLTKGTVRNWSQTYE